MALHTAWSECDAFIAGENMRLSFSSNEIPQERVFFCFFSYGAGHRKIPCFSFRLIFSWTGAVKSIELACPLVLIVPLALHQIFWGVEGCLL
jgi:hypothetical protein